MRFKVNASSSRSVRSANSLDLDGSPRFIGEKTSLLSSPSTIEIDPEPPNLFKWITPALICAFAYALYNVFIKKSSTSINPILGGVILQLVAAIVGSILCLILVLGPAKSDMYYDTQGIMYALLAGVSVGVAEIISFIVSGMGVPVVQSIPVIVGGSVMFGTIIGEIFLAETISLRGWLGVLMIAGGISLVGLESEL